MSTPSEQSFSAFEQAGWDDVQVCAAYDAQLADVTRQSVEALLERAKGSQACKGASSAPTESRR